MEEITKEGAAKVAVNLAILAAPKGALEKAEVQKEDGEENGAKEDGREMEKDTAKGTMR